MSVVTTRTGELEQYYDERFETGYMDEWPAWKKGRIAELLRDQPLPARGRAFDFGCGQGVFTEMLRQSLPGWTLVGSDLSSVALTAARRRFPQCHFVADAETSGLEAFDLVFTHHVLEHVGDLDAILARLARQVRPGGWMVHILPCGNPGSFEHRLASLRRDGVDPANGRFFLDEPGHLRRLRSTDLESALRPLGLTMVSARYANQYWGAVDWMTDLELEDLQAMLDRSTAVDTPARGRLGRLHALLVAARLLKRPPALLFRQRAGQVLAKRSWTWRDRVTLVASNPVFAAAFVLRRWLASRSAREWETRHAEPSGSEMYLVFRREPEGVAAGSAGEIPAGAREQHQGA